LAAAGTPRGASIPHDMPMPPPRYAAVTLLLSCLLPLLLLLLPNRIWPCSQRHNKYPEKNMVSWLDWLMWLDHAMYLGMWRQGFGVETPQATQNTAKRMYASFLCLNRARNIASSPNQQRDISTQHQHPPDLPASLPAGPSSSCCCAPVCYPSPEG
jgi:hypothetical protein